MTRRITNMTVIERYRSVIADAGISYLIMNAEALSRNNNWVFAER